jgi:hypothetical protein
MTAKGLGGAGLVAQILAQDSSATDVADCFARKSAWREGARLNRFVNIVLQGHADQGRLRAVWEKTAIIHNADLQHTEETGLNIFQNATDGNGLGDRGVSDEQRQIWADKASAFKQLSAKELKALNEQDLVAAKLSANRLAGKAMNAAMRGEDPGALIAALEARRTSMRWRCLISGPGTTRPCSAGALRRFGGMRLPSSSSALRRSPQMRRPGTSQRSSVGRRRCRRRLPSRSAWGCEQRAGGLLLFRRGCLQKDRKHQAPPKSTCQRSANRHGLAPASPATESLAPRAHRAKTTIYAGPRPQRHTSPSPQRSPTARQTQATSIPLAGGPRADRWRRWFFLRVPLRMNCRGRRTRWPIAVLTF